MGESGARSEPSWGGSVGGEAEVLITGFAWIALGVRGGGGGPALCGGLSWKNSVN